MVVGRCYFLNGRASAQLLSLPGPCKGEKRWISAPVTIDGWSQGGAGCTGPPRVELNGALAGGNGAGLTMSGGGSVVRGPVINGFIGSFAVKAAAN